MMTIKKIEKIVQEVYDDKTFYLHHTLTKKPLHNIYDLSRFLYGYYHLGLRKNTLLQFLNITNDWRSYDESFLQRLQDANQCLGYHDDDWKVASLMNDDEILVKKYNITILVQKKHLVKPRNLKIGDTVCVKFPKDRIIISSRFYFIISNNGNPDPIKPITRFYFNTDVHMVEAFIRILTRKLSSIGIPFQFKTLLNPIYYKRKDSSVLYVNKSDYDATFATISNIYGQHKNFFLQGTPFFTKKKFPGIGIAENPTNNVRESFGTHRFNLIAKCLLTAQKKKMNSSQLVKFIVRELKKNNLDTNRLYLNSSSSYDKY